MESKVTKEECACECLKQATYAYNVAMVIILVVVLGFVYIVARYM